ncbi:hypothetical protein N5U18_09385 [Aliarcobacter butzleri]|uniref:hypothetical protein n=1 Tax=Aliarcobacter butzleri TaxID=28197 RepID=UPI0021B27F6C|nr:hypothetical protein [Aliarcobacter butzleri]MCT7548701.1 hypothetical protein [Aliarcobacter butzleri]
MKYDIRKHNFKDLIKKSEEYKEYINSKEILDLELAIDKELSRLEREWKVFREVYYDLDQNKEKYTKEYKLEKERIKNLEKETLNENVNFKNEIENLDKVFENIKENVEFYNSFDR